MPLVILIISNFFPRKSLIFQKMFASYCSKCGKPQGCINLPCGCGAPTTSFPLPILRPPNPFRWRNRLRRPKSSPGPNKISLLPVFEKLLLPVLPTEAHTKLYKYTKAVTEKEYSFWSLISSKWIKTFRKIPAFVEKILSNILIPKTLSKVGKNIEFSLHEYLFLPAAFCSFMLNLKHNYSTSAIKFSRFPLQKEEEKPQKSPHPRPVPLLDPNRLSPSTFLQLGTRTQLAYRNR